MTGQTHNPTPAHRISIVPAEGEVRVLFNGRAIAHSKHALRLNEEHLAPVYYVPRDDVEMSLLHRTHHKSHCPFKGDANYFSIEADGRREENAVWSYENPIAAVAEIAGYLAFYPDRVDGIEVLPK